MGKGGSLDEGGGGWRLEGVCGGSRGEDGGVEVEGGMGREGVGLLEAGRGGCEVRGSGDVGVLVCGWRSERGRSDVDGRRGQWLQVRLAQLSVHLHCLHCRDRDQILIKSSRLNSPTLLRSLTRRQKRTETLRCLRRDEGWV